MLRFYVLEPWNMFGLWWLDRGAQTKCRHSWGGSLGDYLSNIQPRRCQSEVVAHPGDGSL